MNDTPQILIHGHLNVTDETGHTHVDKCNAIHPQNMARVIGRALANEHNSNIWRIAFGNGGTEITAANQIEYKTPNDGQPPDHNTWNSRLYNEIYSEIIDDGLDTLNPLLGTDPGSSDFNNQRSGGGAVPEFDPATVPHVSGPGVRSNELGLTSEVVITAVLNQNEPIGQYSSDISQGTQPFESSFVFDELGLYSNGAQAGSTTAYQNVDVGTKGSNDNSPLISTAYGFTISVDGGSSVIITFVPPVSGGSGAGGEITYGDICEALNTQDPVWQVSNPLPAGSACYISDDGDGSYATISGAQTFGYMQFQSSIVGASSSVDVGSYTDANTANLWDSLQATVLTAVQGSSAGVQNNPVNGDTERERLLSHVIFSPVLKAENRILTITYTLTISVARTTSSSSA